MNPLRPRHLKPLERRAELCRILALGLIRLRARDPARASTGTGDFPLHYPTQQSGSADARHRRDT